MYHRENMTFKITGQGCSANLQYLNGRYTCMNHASHTRCLTSVATMPTILYKFKCILPYKHQITVGYILAYNRFIWIFCTNAIQNEVFA